MCRPGADRKNCRVPHIVSPLASPAAAAFAPGVRAVKTLVGQELRAHPVLLVWTPVVILGAVVLMVAAVVVGTWLTDTAPEPISPGGREKTTSPGLSRY